MWIKFHFDTPIRNDLYSSYCRYLYDKINDELSSIINSNHRKYQLRSEYILSNHLIDWVDDKYARYFNLESLLMNCLYLVREDGEYIVKVTDDLIPHSTTPVSRIVRLVEYGNESIKPLPAVRKVIDKYRLIYRNLFSNFMMERMFR